MSEFDSMEEITKEAQLKNDEGISEFQTIANIEKIIQEVILKYGSDFANRVRTLYTRMRLFVENADSGMTSGPRDSYYSFVNDLQQRLGEDNLRMQDLEVYNWRINTILHDIHFIVMLGTLRNSKSVGDHDAAVQVVLQQYDHDSLRVSNEIIERKSEFLVLEGSYKGINVAVKRLVQNNFSRHSEINFKREAMILQILSLKQFPGVVSFYGVDDINFPQAIVLEHSKCTLLQYMQSEISLDERLDILRQCCSVFASLIDHKVLHRDIKPENILITSDNRPKITNFGFVRSVEVGLSIGVTLRGTHSYIAPEVLMSTSGIFQYSEATDMYSFAVMMNAVLTNRIPFQQYSHMQLMGLMYKSQGSLRPDIVTESSFPGNSGRCQTLASLIGLCWSVLPGVRLSFRQLEDKLRLVIPLSESNSSVVQPVPRPKAYIPKLEEKPINCTMVDMNSFVISSTEIGHGSYSKVFRGILNEKAVAVKCLIKPVEHYAVLRFLNEVKALEHLREFDFPHLIRYYGVDDTFSNIVLELGYGTLSDVIHKPETRTVLDVDARFKLQMLLHCCLGVISLHDEGIIHRDLKPGNLLLCEGRVLKIIDYNMGQAELFGATNTDGPRGTFGYMPYEAIFGNPPAYTEASDMYSFGIIMNEVFTELEPDERNYIAKILQNKHFRPNLCQTIEGLTPPDVLKVQDLIRKAWAHEPIERPNFRFMYSELKTIYDSIPNV